MRIGVLGGSGYIGSSIVEAMKSKAIDVVVARRVSVNYLQKESLVKWLEQNGISFLINAAGFTGQPNVDACEVRKAECLEGNSLLPGVVRASCETIGIPFGHVSSGCIFSGAKPDGSGFNETDTPNFCFRSNHCSFYSGCKALGEELLEGCNTCYIWRLRIPFNHEDNARNYLSKLLRYSQLLDARNSLTHLNDFANSCVACIVDRVPYGVYNLTNGGSVTTREVVDMLRATISPHQSFSFFENEAAFMRQAAIAPRSNCVLSNEKAIAAGLPLRGIVAALMDSLANWQPESADADHVTKAR